MRTLRHALLLAAVLATAAPAMAAETLYDSLGGQAGIAAIVRIALEIHVNDPRLAADLDNINLDRLRPRVAEQLCALTGGPCTYRGRPMGAAHAGLVITQAKFNAFAEGTQAAMGQLGIPYRTQNRLMALLAPMQRDIVNH